MAKKFLLGLAGVGVGSAGGVALNHHITDDSGLKIGEMGERQLIRKIGLYCGGWIWSGSECSVRPGRKINIQIGTDRKQGFLPSEDQPGKIRVYRSEKNKFNGGLRFTVEGGNIQLTNGEETLSLNEFEGYGIDVDNDVWYLVRKDTQDQGKIRALGLPDSCSLPANGNGKTECSISRPEDVNFEGKGQTSKLGGSAKLSIFGVKKEEPFGDGYRFMLVSNGDLTISGSNSVWAQTATDFRIKRRDNGSLTLERAWSPEKLIEKAGLECSNDVCSIKPGVKINVKQDNNKKKEIDSISSNGTIRLLRDQSGYREGIKFEIEGGDITLNGGRTDGRGGNVSKLWKEDSYEIFDSEGDYYLSRRDSGLTKRRNDLGLPACQERQKCQINLEQLKQIKFHNRNEGEELRVTEGSQSPKINLEIFTTGDRGYHLNKKIKIQVADATIRIPQKNSKSMMLWKGAEVEFKIREEDGELSLEKGFDINGFVKDLGLKGNCEDEAGCPVGTSIKVEGGRHYSTAAVKDEFRNKRIRYEALQKGFSREVKFILPEDIELTNKPNGFSEGKLPKGIYEVKVRFVGQKREFYLSLKSRS